jgi:hypothetical protein
MKIKCIENSICDDFLSKYFLDLNTEYVVYAVAIEKGNLIYCICDRAYSYHPRWKPARYFEITDSRISRYWIFLLDGPYPILSFPEWANQSDFYGNLCEGEKTEVTIFQSYKGLMDLEFPNSRITQTAQIIDREWLMCPSCFDAWKHYEVQDALICCPKCKTVWNNPRYKNEWPHL